MPRWLATCVLVSGSCLKTRGRDGALACLLFTSRCFGPLFPLTHHRTIRLMKRACQMHVSGFETRTIAPVQILEVEEEKELSRSPARHPRRSALSEGDGGRVIPPAACRAGVGMDEARVY